LAQNPVIREILRQGAKLPADVRRRYILAALETGRIESNFTNPAGGDADSQGWRQERASLYRDPRNLKDSVARFYQEAAQQDRGQKSYQLAADVQRPAKQFRGRYKTAASEALGLLAGTGTGNVPSPRIDLRTPVQSTPGVPAVAPIQQNMDMDARRAAAFSFLQAGGIKNPMAVQALASTITALRQQPAPPVSTVATSPGRVAVPLPKTSHGSGQASPTRGVGGPLLELFWQGPGGINVKDGNPEPQGFVSGHTDHVHVAAGRKSVVRIGKLAEQMGLHVGENPHFGGVSQGVHVKDSYHYKGEAIDVSSPDQKLMARFAHRVAKIYGVR
jgi:hypothetical protein